MLEREQFVHSVCDAYQHFYDIVYLRMHALADILVPDPSMRRKEKAWQLHHILLDVIDELDPGTQAPVFSREWRRHRLMVLRYVDGLDPQAVADELSISRRHFYREHDAAIEAVASILWNRYVVRPTQAAQPPLVSQEQADADRLDLLRMEAARLNQASRYTRLPEVVDGAVRLVQGIAGQRGVQVQVTLGQNSPDIGVDCNILRQILLGLLSHLLERLTEGEIRIGDVWEENRAFLTLYSRGARSVAGSWGELSTDVRFSMLSELAVMQEARIHPIVDGEGIAGFKLELPTLPPRTVLVLDDNEDMLQLFQRYLYQHHYQIVATQTGSEAIRLAAQLQPYAIILDLMLPDTDGWDVLQTLTNRPETHHIPVIICTVLSARQLALSLGAAAFLEKPVAEQTLLAALGALEEK